MKVPFRIRHFSPSNTYHPECAFCAKDLLQYFDFIAVGLVLLRTGQSVLVRAHQVHFSPKHRGRSFGQEKALRMTVQTLVAA